MTIYTVHLPRETTARFSEAERAVLIPERFSWGATLLGPLWLLAHRAWRGFFMWLALTLAVGLTVASLRLSGAVGVFACVPLALFFGLEGRQFVRARLERRGYRLADIVTARNAQDAEHIFFLRRFGPSEGARAGSAASAQPNAPPSGDGEIDHPPGAEPAA